MKLLYKAILLVTTLSFANKAFSQAPNITYQSPQIYVVNTAITDLLPANTGGAIPVLPTQYGQVTTFAGGGSLQPSGVVTDAGGNVYITGYGGGQIQKISPAGAITNLGNINSPSGIAIDNQGNLYITSFDDNQIYKLTQTGVKSVFAGSGLFGSVDGMGTAASFFGPGGICTDAAGNLYVADQANNRIRKITPTGVVTTIAGNDNGGATNGIGLAATFNNPDALTIDAQGNIYVADTKNNLIRKITPAGLVSTFAGSGTAGNIDGTGTSASFNYPTGITIDANGNLYVADYKNNQIRKITPAGVVTTLAGNGTAGSTNGVAKSASFNAPLNLAFDVSGSLYVSDFNNGYIRKITLTGYTIDKPLPAGLTFDPTTGKISGTPTVPSAPANYTITAYNKDGNSTTVLSIAVNAIGTCTPTTLTILPFDNIVVDNDGNFIPKTTTTNPVTPIIFSSSDPNVATAVAGGTKIHAVAPGRSIITATQAGSGVYCDVTATSTLTITTTQPLVFPAIPEKTICNTTDFSANVFSLPDSGMPVVYQSSNPGVATISAQGMIHIVGAGTTTITASQDGAEFYVKATPQSQVLTVKPAVTPVISIGPDIFNSCDGLPVTYIATAINQGTNPQYQWQVNGVPAGTNSTSFTSSTLHTNDKITCTVTNNTDCTTTATATSNTATITVNPNITPTINIQSSVNGAVCSGTPITFTASSTNTGIRQSYQWQVNNHDAGDNNNTFTSSNLNNNDVVTCIVTSLGGACLTTLSATSNPLTVIISTPQVPTITITASANHVYGGVPVTFVATTNLTSGAIYQWQVNGINAGTNTDTFTSSTLNDGDVVTCTISAGDSGCFVPATSQSITMSIMAPANIPIPNTFTPNADGTNDFWNIPALAYYPTCLVNIYDRYGALVYQSRGYSQPWDGTMSGKRVPVSTYYYIINLGTTQPKISGSVTVIR